MSSEIKTEKNVFILGAGFSRKANMPLIRDFLIKSREAIPWLEQYQRIKEVDSIMQVFNYRKSSASTGYYCSIDLENIEELFSLASADPDRNDLDEKIRTAICSTIDYCASTSKPGFVCVSKPGHLPSSDNWQPFNGTGIHSFYQNDSAGTFYKIPLYTYYISLIINLFNNNKSDDSIITFNYDLLIENAARSINLKIDYSIPDENIKIKPSWVAPISNNSIRLLKLHGSTNWSYSDKKLSIYDDYSSLYTSDMIPFIVPPTWRKNMDGPLSHVWRSAIDELKNASQIIFIGFSMPETDFYIKFLISLGLKENINLTKVIFVNPIDNVDEQKIIIDRFKKKFGDQVFRLELFKPYWMKAEHFFMNFSGDVFHTYGVDPLSRRKLQIIRANVEYMD